MNETLVFDSALAALNAFYGREGYFEFEIFADGKCHVTRRGGRNIHQPAMNNEPESKQERAYREKQEALRKAEHDRNQEEARRLREAGEVLSRDYTQPHDHKLGWMP